MASFGSLTPMLPGCSHDNARVSVWGEHVGKELAAQPRDYNRQFQILQPNKLEAVEAKAGLQAPVETRRRMRRTLVAENSKTEELRAKLAGLYVKHHGVDLGQEPRGPRRVKPGGAPITPPRSQSLPAKKTEGAFGVDGRDLDRPDAPGDPPPADSLDEFKGHFMKQLTAGRKAPRERGISKPLTSNQELGWEPAKRLSQPALQRLAERTRLSSCDETKYGSNYVGTWGRGLYQSRKES
jgi:hypothetical protein